MSDINSITKELAYLYNLLDPIRESLSSKLEKWDVPEVVVFGIESAGKSTILERIALRRIFPKGEDLCTRMLIRVELRNRAERLDPVLYVKKRSEVGADVILSGPNVADAKSIEKTMREVIQTENNAVRGIVLDTYLLLRIEGPEIPNLNLLDIPGMLLNVRDGEDSKMREETKNLVRRVIKESIGRAIYLAIMEIGERPKASITIEILEEFREDIYDWTIGVLTKCDESNKKKIVKALKEQKKFTKECVATSNEVNEDCSFEEQTEEELEFFADNGMKDLIKKGSVTTNALIERIGLMYRKHLEKEWLPQTIQLLNEKLQDVEKDVHFLNFEAGYEEGRERLVKAVLDFFHDINDQLYDKVVSAQILALQENYLQEIAKAKQKKSIKEFQLWASIANGRLEKGLYDSLTKHIVGFLDGVFQSIADYYWQSLDDNATALEVSSDIRVGRDDKMIELFKKEITLEHKRKQGLLSKEFQKDLKKMIMGWCVYSIEKNQGALSPEETKRSFDLILHRIFEEIYNTVPMMKNIEAIVRRFDVVDYHQYLLSFSEEYQFLRNELFELFELPAEYEPNSAGVVAK